MISRQTLYTIISLFLLIMFFYFTEDITVSIAFIFAWLGVNWLASICGKEI